MTMRRTALLLGATGLVGGHCLELLLCDDAYERIVTLSRRAVRREHQKLTSHVVHFDELEASAPSFQAQDLFCCLGTTIKQAGSREAFRRVDFDLPLAAARLALSRGTEQFLLVSSLGADARSSIFYSRVKGELEEAVSQLPFRAVNIFRPSLLTGERAAVRPGERAAETLSRVFGFTLVGPLRKYHPIAAHRVAAAMLAIAKRQLTGVNVFESDELQSLNENLR